MTMTDPTPSQSAQAQLNAVVDAAWAADDEVTRLSAVEEHGPPYPHPTEWEAADTAATTALRDLRLALEAFRVAALDDVAAVRSIQQRYDDMEDVPEQDESEAYHDAFEQLAAIVEALTPQAER